MSSIPSSELSRWLGDDMTTGSLGKPVDQTVFLYGSHAANWVFPKIGAADVLSKTGRQKKVKWSVW